MQCIYLLIGFAICSVHFYTVAQQGYVPPGADHESAALSTLQIYLQKFKI